MPRDNIYIYIYIYIYICIWRMFVFMSVVVTVWRSVGMFVVLRPLLKVNDSVFSLGVLNYVVCLWKGCDGCCVFCFYCDAWTCRCSCMGGMLFRHADVVCLCASCGCSQFFMTCSLFMLVQDARGDHMEEASSRACLMTALWVVMSVSFCLPHPVAVSAL